MFVGTWKLESISQATEEAALIDSDVHDFARLNNFYYDADFGWLMMPNKGVLFSKSNFAVSDINNHVIGYTKKNVEFYTYRDQGVFKIRLVANGFTCGL